MLSHNPPTVAQIIRLVATMAGLRRSEMCEAKTKDAKIAVAVCHKVLCHQGWAYEQAAKELSFVTEGQLSKWYRTYAEYHSYKALCNDVFDYLRRQEELARKRMEIQRRKQQEAEEEREQQRLDTIRKCSSEFRDTSNPFGITYTKEQRQQMYTAKVMAEQFMANYGKSPRYQ